MKEIDEAIEHIEEVMMYGSKDHFKSIKTALAALRTMKDIEKDSKCKAIISKAFAGLYMDKFNSYLKEAE